MTSLDPGGDDGEDGAGGGGGKRTLTVDELVDATLRRSKRVRVQADTTPSLSAALAGAGTEGPCGGFTRIRNWTVTNGRRGLIIQRVTRTFAVERHNGSTWGAIADDVLNGYVTDAGSSVCALDTNYWEVWRVRADGSVINNGDRFALCSLIPLSTAPSYANTTKGTFTMTGVAAFYPTDRTPADLGFAAGAVEAAGGLPSRTADPAGDLASAGVVASGADVTYTVTVTWDSAWPGPPNTADVPFIPPNALSIVTQT